MDKIMRHADHDPAVICRPAGYGVCEILRQERHVGWHCEHVTVTSLPEVAPSSTIVNAQCGCTMAPVYVAR